MFNIYKLKTNFLKYLLVIQPIKIYFSLKALLEFFKLKFIFTLHKKFKIYFLVLFFHFSLLNDRSTNSLPIFNMYKTIIK